MRSISVFNNKGGVGKTTLTYHLACALASLGVKTLLVDMDPQCNLTVYCMDPETLHNIWLNEDDYIDDYKRTRDSVSAKYFTEIMSANRSIHFLLKPVEDGVEEKGITKPFNVRKNLDILPGRLSLHLYEDKVSSRWSDVYQGDPLAIRTVTRVRGICEEYAKKYNYDIVIIDTSPSLGALNKVIISTTDCFIIPCMPDMFSMYGIRNIGNSLAVWKKQFDTLFQLLSPEKRKSFPSEFVRFLGYTIYNARKYSGQNEFDIAKAQYNYAKLIPDTIRDYIPKEARKHLSQAQIRNPIGDKSVMHSHSTMVNMAQKYRRPIWSVPDCDNLDREDKSTIMGNQLNYKNTKKNYINFANEVTERLLTLGSKDD